MDFDTRVVAVGGTPAGLEDAECAAREFDIDDKGVDPLWMIVPGDQLAAACEDAADGASEELAEVDVVDERGGDDTAPAQAVLQARRPGIAGQRADDLGR